MAMTVAGCQSKSSGSASGPSSGIAVPVSGHSGGAQDPKKVTDGIKRLMDSLEKPEAPFHFSYQAKENVNPKFPMQAGELPKLGPVTVEADVSSDDVSVTENRNGKQTQSKASKSDPAGLGLAKLGVMGCMLDATFPFAYGGVTAHSAGSGSVGGVAADKFDMDTTTADASTQTALAMLGGMLNGKVKIKSVKGSAWLEKSSGRLVKFNLDTDLSTQDGQSWQEHYEALVTPK
ncbi:MAG TPA: hypothetical protein VI488_02100 [Candidatus Angelobacter sp.]